MASNSSPKPKLSTTTPYIPPELCGRHSFTAYAQGYDVIHLCLRSLECHHQRSIQTSSFCSLLIHSNNRRTNFFSFPFYDNDSIAKRAIKLELPLRHRRSCTDRAGNCHGLLCIANNNKKDVALWNPSIQRFKRISFSLSEIMESEVARFGFGYDSATDDYKVVRIMEFRTSNGFCSSEVKVYGLKSNSWKRVQNLPSNHRYFGSYIHCLNSALHWLTNPDLGNTFIILTLDLVSEKYHEFPTPEDVMHAFPLPGLTALGGWLCFIVNNKAGSHVWAMKEYGVTKSWVMLFKKKINESDVPWIFAVCTPLRFSKSGQMVVLKNNYFEPPDSFDKISWYDMEKKRSEPVKKVMVFGVTLMQLFVRGISMMAML